MKKLVSILLTAMLIMSALTGVFTVSADEATPVWDGTANIQWYLDGPNADGIYELDTAEDLAGLAFIVGAGIGDGRYMGVYYVEGGDVKGYVPGKSDNALWDTDLVPTDFTGLEMVDGDYIVLVPQCPTDTWTGLDVENGNYSIANVAESAVMKSVYGLVHDVAMKYNTSGSYAAGVSAGAYAVADLSARHNDLFKAVVLIAGAGDPSASIGNTKVMICHGEGDEKIPVADARELADAWNAEYQEYSRELHDCWTVVFAREDVVGWLNEN